jgi:hypothetical protein
MQLTAYIAQSAELISNVPFTLCSNVSHPGVDTPGFTMPPCTGLE